MAFELPGDLGEDVEHKSITSAVTEPPTRALYNGLYASTIETNMFTGHGRFFGVCYHRKRLKIMGYDVIKTGSTLVYGLIVENST